LRLLFWLDLPAWFSWPDSSSSTAGEQCPPRSHGRLQHLSRRECSFEWRERRADRHRPHFDRTQTGANASGVHDRGGCNVEYLSRLLSLLPCARGISAFPRPGLGEAGLFCDPDLAHRACGGSSPAGATFPELWTACSLRSPSQNFALDISRLALRL